MIALVASLAAAAAVGRAVGGALLQTDGRRDAFEPRRRGLPASRRSCSTSASGPTARRATCGGARASSPTGSARRRRRSSSATRRRRPRRPRARALARGLGRRAPRALAAEHPRSALVRLNLGFALFWSGAREQAVEQWREAERLEPDTLSAVRADDLLHPNTPRGRPVFVPAQPFPERIASLPADRQLTELAAAAADGGAAEKLQYGVVLQRLGRPLSARRVYDQAAALAPNDPEALVAAAVGRYDKDDPAAAFSRLGPLARRFPDAPTVRFHLGLLLLWTGAIDEAKEQLERAAAIDPADPLAREAKRFLTRLARRWDRMTQR